MSNEPNSGARIVLIDDHYFFRLGVKEYLLNRQNDPPITLIGEAEDGRQGLDLILHTQPDVAIIDLYMPVMNGIELLQILGEMPVVPQVIIHSGYLEEDILLNLINLGAQGYLLKGRNPEFLIQAILTVAQGRYYFDAVTPQQIPAHASTRQQLKHRLKELSPREYEVLKCLLNDLGRAEIAVQLGIQSSTVDTYRKRILQKLEIDSLRNLYHYFPILPDTIGL